MSEPDKDDRAGKVVEGWIGWSINQTTIYQKPAPIREQDETGRGRPMADPQETKPETREQQFARWDSQNAARAAQNQNRAGRARARWRSRLIVGVVVIILAVIVVMLF